MGRVRDTDPLAFAVDGVFGSGNVGIDTPFEPDNITSYGRLAQRVIRGTTGGHTLHRALVRSVARDGIASHLHSISYRSCWENSRGVKHTASLDRSVMGFVLTARRTHDESAAPLTWKCVIRLWADVQPARTVRAKRYFIVVRFCNLDMSRFGRLEGYKT